MAYHAEPRLTREQYKQAGAPTGNYLLDFRIGHFAAIVGCLNRQMLLGVSGKLCASRTDWAGGTKAEQWRVESQT